MKEQLKDIGIRALKTFVQAFLAVVLVAVPTIDNFDKLWAVLVAAVAAGISATWNSFVAANNARKQ
jgi:hypothetical protein